MKLYATVTSERATKGQGGNKRMSVTFQIGSTKKSTHVLTIRAQITPREASIADREMAVFTIFQEGEGGGRIGEKIVFDLESGKEITSREDALALKGKQQKGEKWQDIDIQTGELIDRHE